MAQKSNGSIVALIVTEILVICACIVLIIAVPGALSPSSKAGTERQYRPGRMNPNRGLSYQRRMILSEARLMSRRTRVTEVRLAMSRTTLRLDRSRRWVMGRCPKKNLRRNQVPVVAVVEAMVDSHTVCRNASQRREPFESLGRST